MANILDSFGECQSSSRPPLFCGDNYAFWKVRMRIFLQAQGREIWKCIVNGPYIPTKVVDGVKVKKEEQDLTTIGKVYSKVEIVRKILKSLPKRWESKVTAILEVRDLKKLEVNELIGENDEDEKNEDKDEEVAMITRRIQRFLKKNKTPPRKSFKKFSKKDSGKNDTLICYKCNKPGYIKSDCPLLKKDRNKGKKVMKATWDDDSSSSTSEASNGESANFCLMAKDDIEVTNFDNIEDPSYKKL
ncbi:hypothetical protein I3760_01G079900 [Carya illinoinensis]|nr:hypothetical protein I3760_01G079900 [Carya illinoinensis]